MVTVNCFFRTLEASTELDKRNFVGTCLKGHVQKNLPLKGHTKYTTLIQSVASCSLIRLYALYNHWNRKTGTPEEFHDLVVAAVRKLKACLSEPQNTLRICIYSGAADVG